MREVYCLPPQMGITLMGGLLAWLFSFKPPMIGHPLREHKLLSLAGAWRIAAVLRNSQRYISISYSCSVLAPGFHTPHTIVMTPAELKAMVVKQHPVLGNYG